MSETKNNDGSNDEKKNLAPALNRVWDDLVSKVESSPGIWEKPWFTAGMGRPYNPVTKRSYHGFNYIHLEISRLSRGYTLNQWMTFKQAKSAGGFVKKGEHGTPIVVFVPPVYKKDESGKETDEILRPAYWTYAIVFNIEQTTITPEKAPDVSVKNYSIPEVEEIITKTGARINHVYQGRAYYAPAVDAITLPEPGQFKSQAEYYGTKFHELVHWTGHESRLNRLSKCAGFGSQEYSREELVAEIGSVFLKNETGITDGIDNAAAYIKNWWGNIKEDRGSLITAAGQADKAVSYILNPPVTKTGAGGA